MAGCHDECVEGVSDPCFVVLSGGKVSEEGSTWSLEHVVGKVDDPEAKDAHDDGVGANFFFFGGDEGVAEEVADVNGEGNEVGGKNDGKGCGGN